jgi:uncharacterized membrane protein YfcA
MEWWQYLLLTGCGVVAGFMNVMAGGGSLITMPVLIFLGLQPAAANGTNRVAILIQNITAVTSFKKKGFSDVGMSLGLSLCTVPGAVVGAVAAIAIDPISFKRILAVVLVASLILVISRRSSDGAAPATAHPVWAHLAAVGVGFYGGFIQAGVGFILMPLLQRLLALDLVRVNMHKVFIIGVYTVPALLVFALKGQVWWIAGLALAVGNATGGWIGTHVTVSRGERAIKFVFTAAVVAMSVKLFLG